MTSLQRASEAVARKHNDKGKFEACFAQGLDLSEFSSDSIKNGGGHHQSSSSRSSAAAERLLAKAKEKEQLERDAREEWRLQELAKVRALELQDCQLLRKQQEAEPLRLPAPGQKNEEEQLQSMSSGSSSSSSSEMARQNAVEWSRKDVVFSTLVHMHVGDEAGGAKRIRKQGKAKRKHDGAAGSLGTRLQHSRERHAKKKAPTKKTRRTKH